jgi:hypothetical protein
MAEPCSQAEEDAADTGHVSVMTIPKSNVGRLLVTIYLASGIIALLLEKFWPYFHPNSEFDSLLILMLTLPWSLLGLLSNVEYSYYVKLTQSILGLILNTIILSFIIVRFERFSSSRS